MAPIYSLLTLRSIELESNNIGLAGTQALTAQSVSYLTSLDECRQLQDALNVRYLRARDVVSAAANGDLSTLQKFISTGANLWSQCDYKHNTALHAAAQGEHLHLVRWLVQQNKSLIKARNYAGKTPLQLAEEAKQTNVLEYFNMLSAIVPLSIAPANVMPRSDDIEVVAAPLGYQPIMVSGRSDNIKVTTPADYLMMKKLMTSVDQPEHGEVEWCC